MRRLKKADFEVDFFFMDEVEFVSLSGGGPEKVIATLGVNLHARQHFFGREIWGTRELTRVPEET